MAKVFELDFSRLERVSSGRISMFNVGSDDEMPNWILDNVSGEGTGSSRGELRIDDGSLYSDSPLPIRNSKMLMAGFLDGNSGLKRASVDWKFCRTQSNYGSGYPVNPFIKDEYFLVTWQYWNPSFALTSSSYNWAVAGHTAVNNEAGAQSAQTGLYLRTFRDPPQAPTDYKLEFADPTDVPQWGTRATNPLTWDLDFFRGKWTEIWLYVKRGLRANNRMALWVNRNLLLDAGGFAQLENSFLNYPWQDGRWMLTYPKTYSENAGLCRIWTDYAVLYDAIPDNVPLPQPPTPECSTDSECVSKYGENYVCVNGTCVYQPPVIEPPIVTNVNVRPNPANVGENVTCQATIIGADTVQWYVQDLEGAYQGQIFPMGTTNPWTHAFPDGNARLVWCSAQNSGGSTVSTQVTLTFTEEPPPTPECTTDADCVALHGANYICVNGTCVYQEPEPQMYNLTISVNGDGTTSPSPGVHPYEDGTDVLCTAIPGSGWYFVNWTGTMGSPIPASQFIIGMLQDQTITANFAEIPPEPEPTPTPQPTMVARSYGGLGLPAIVLNKLWRLREKFISKEVHKKLHPVV